MKHRLIMQLVITGVMMMAIIFVAVAFSVAWYIHTTVVPFSFEVTADGVLYVYVDSDIQSSDDALAPAIAMPYAVEQGLPIDVLRAYNADDVNKSYVQTPAKVASVNGRFTVYNAEAGYQKVVLEKDSEGYTLYPKIDIYGNIQWLSDDHTYGNWETTRFQIGTKVVISQEYDELTGEYHEVEIKEPVYSADTDYQPLIDGDGKIKWKANFRYETITSEEKPYINYYFYTCSSCGIHTTGEKVTCPECGGTITEVVKSNGEWCYFGMEYWECRDVPVQGASTSTVIYKISFKKTPTSSLDDYYDKGVFTIKRLYFTTSSLNIPEEDMASSSEIIPIQFQSSDLTYGEIVINGTTVLVMHAEVYFTHPDELIDPAIRGQSIYMAVELSLIAEQEVTEE